MKYGIAWQDMNGEEHPRHGYGQFNSYAKAKVKAKELNAAIRVQGTGKFVVVEL